MSKKKLTVKEQKLVTAKAKGKKHDEAWDEAGYSQNTSKKVKVVNASKVLSKPHVKEALNIALARNGITLDKALAPIGKALTATKVEITGQGDQAFAEVVEDIDLQLKGSDRALKLMGINKDQQGGDVHYHLHQAEQREKYDL